MNQHPIIYQLPGLLCDKDTWQYQTESLSQHAQIRIPDHRGLDSLDAVVELVLDEAPA